MIHPIMTKIIANVNILSVAELSYLILLMMIPAGINMAPENMRSAIVEEIDK